MDTRTDQHRRPIRTPLLLAALFGAWIGISGCDFSVTNPGPAEDDFLNGPEAHQSVVNGMARAMTDALGAGEATAIALATAAVTRELMGAGNTGNHGINVNQTLGLLNPDETSGFWNEAQNARWVAEDGIRRFEEVMDSGEFQSSALVAEAHLWAGFANRLLGENWCQAVIDGGAAQSNEVFLERAETYFTNAMQIAASAGATDLENAGRAGRATVRMDLGDWNNAVADAQAVVADAGKEFEFEAHFFGVDISQYNTFYWGIADEPYRTTSVWNTPWEQYFLDSDDPRVAWTTTDQEFGDAARQCCGQVPFLAQQKYPVNDANIDLADGREMRLIEAEALLVDGDFGPAMDIVNELRADVGVDPVSAADLDEAWTLFRRERGIELWLEGRRMNDFRRWEEAGRPGDPQPLEDEQNPDTFLSPDRDLCFPIPDSELETNPNL